MLIYGPVGTAEFGEGRAAAMALEAKHQRDGESSMQGLHDPVASLQVTVADKYDPARVIQEWHHVCVELEPLGDVAVPTRKARAFFTVLQNENYECAHLRQAARRQLLEVRGYNSPCNVLPCHADSWCVKVQETNMMQAVRRVH